MFHKIKNVSALPEFRLSVQFAEGVTKLYDVKPLFDKLPVFRSLADHPEEFACVSVDVGGYGIIWNDDLDLSCDELWGLNESTLRKAIAYGKLVNGVDVCKFGKQWVVSMEAMQREYGAAGKKSPLYPIDNMG